MKVKSTIALLACLSSISSVCILLAIGSVAAAQTRSPDRWSDGNGVLQAEAVIGNCISDLNAPQSAGICVPRAFEACEDEHGTSQRQMNDCATFSRLAWEGRRADAVKRLMAAKSSGARFPLSEPHIKHLAESERRWDAWNRSDCEMQAAFSEGGTYHRYDLDICLSNHAANRALELERLIDVWQKIFLI